MQKSDFSAFLIIFYTIYAGKAINSLSTLHLTPAAPLLLNQPFPHEKRRSPAFNHFVLGCQRRVALPTQTKYPLELSLIDVLVVVNSYLATLERSLCVRF